MRAKITKRVVDAIEPGTKTILVWDTEVRGFGLKLTPSGSQTYVLQYRMGGRGHPTRRYTIGPHGPLTPDEARRRALQLRARIAEGIDPSSERVEVRRKALAGGPKTFGPLAELFIQRECSRLARGHDVASVVRREILPHWDSRPIAELRKRDALVLTDALGDAGKPAAALKLYEVIKRIGNWLVERDELEVSPFANMKPPADKAIRDRVLSPAEISYLWLACERIGYPFGPIVQLLLLTGQRRNEVAGMRWLEVDLGAAEWTIPGDRSKNDKPHLVPLAGLVLGILQSLPRFDGPHVFTGTRGTRPFAGFGKAKARLDRLIRQVMQDRGTSGRHQIWSPTEIVPWRLHDLRRTCRTGMAALGVSEPVSERVLNHQPNVLARTYNLHAYGAEKRDALERWARNVMDVVEPPAANVIPIGRSSGSQILEWNQ